MSAVVGFTGVTVLGSDPQRVLEAALKAGMTEVVVCGFDGDGGDYFASSAADAGDAGYHLDRAKWRLMRQVDRMQEGEE